MIIQLRVICSCPERYPTAKHQLAVSEQKGI